MLVDAKNRYGWTPLHHVATKGHTEIVKSLIEKGAAVNAKNEDGWTPLHYSSQTTAQSTAFTPPKTSIKSNLKLSEEETQAKSTTKAKASSTQTKESI